MKTLAYYSNYNSIIQRTTLTNYKLGFLLAHTGAVEIIKLTSKRVIARVIGRHNRRTILETTENGLVSKCTCGENFSKLCKHVVATAIITEEKSA